MGKKVGLTMRRQPISLIEILIFISIYPLLFLIITISIVGTSLLFNYVPRIPEIASKPTVITRSWRWAVLPTAPPATALAVANLAIPSSQPVDTPSEIQAEMAAFVGVPTGVVAPQPVYAASVIDRVESSPIAPSLPTDNPYVREAIDPTTPPPTPTATPTYTMTPLPTDTPMPTHIPTTAATPNPTATPMPEYDYMLAEFFNSPTTNSFLMVYVAIIDPNEIPIGDLKVVGIRQDHNLTYESPLSTWYYEGYSAPGEVIKSGNVKFEPPGGIESTRWVLHLEDAHSNRQSEDVSFDVDINDKQWYFIKFRRKY